MFAQLVPINGGEPITIDKDITVVGRQSEHCDIVLTRKSVSKIHCVIAKTDGLLFVRDLDSTNGTKVNGQRIVRGALLPGDQLAFAGEKFKVHMGPSNGAPNGGKVGPVEPAEVGPARAQTPVSEDFAEEKDEPTQKRKAASASKGPEDLVE